jgi:hypothetical protein
MAQDGIAGSGLEVQAFKPFSFFVRLFTTPPIPGTISVHHLI